MLQKSEKAAEIMNQESFLYQKYQAEHSVATWGYTHSMPNYGQILKEGFNSYHKRINKAKNADFRDGLNILLDGIFSFRKRCISHISENNTRKDLIMALKKVPFKSAASIYEALVGWVFLYFLDGL